MYDEGRLRRDYPGYLIEWLLFNVPDALYGKPALTADVRACSRGFGTPPRRRERGERFLGLRDDKGPNEVVPELAA